MLSNWFECKVRYDKTQENGSIKKVTEPYLVDAMSFTEAEARIIEELTPFISGDFNVSAVKRTKYAEIVWDDSADRWYQVKTAYISIDEKGNEKKVSVLSLVAAKDFRGALDAYNESMKGTTVDYEIQTINETPIMDVFKMKVVE